MKHSTNYIGKVGIQRCPISEDETMILHDYHYREILEDQEGGKYFIAEDGETWYFDLLPLNGTKPTATPLPSIHEEGKFTPGEWEVHKLEGKFATKIFEGYAIQSHGVIAIITTKDYGETISKANAALIAESKNLYTALKETVNTLDAWIKYVGDGYLNESYQNQKTIKNSITTLANAKAILNRIK